MNRYSHLLSPIKLRNTVVKSRLFFPNALPHFQQGPENYPADPIITFYSELAKNGAGIILYHHTANKEQRNSPNLDGRHFPMYEPEDPGVQNYMCQLTDCIHYYGGLAAVDLFYEMGRDLAPMDSAAGSDSDTLADMAAYLKMLSGDNDLDISQVPAVFGMGAKHGMSETEMEAFIDEGVKQAVFLKNMGFNAGHIEIARYSLFGQFLSPVNNQRTDQYGGNPENRMRFPRMAIHRLREALGDDFLLIAECTCQEMYDNAPLEDYVAFLKEMEQDIDLLHVRYGMYATGYDATYEESRHPITLDFCAKMKAMGVKIPICGWTGFTDLDDMEAAIASGRIDMISAGRLLIANPDLGPMLEEGRGEDVVPCIKCNRCHGVSLTGEWVSVCTVNPQMGLYARIHRMVTEPVKMKKIAIIGGGPAGMYAAKVAAERRHDVTLFEKSDHLGGQLTYATQPSFKWPLRNLQQYLIAQMERKAVNILLNTTATPELISQGSFDAVIVAIGAVPRKPQIQGADTTPWNPITIYGHEDELGENVVCIGGSESSAEIALHLAQNGHKVTILSRQRQLAHDANPVHWQDIVARNVSEHENITVILNATTTNIASDAVTYQDAEGNLFTLPCDSVVAAGGMQALQDVAMQFFNTAPVFRMIGDCKQVGDVRKCFRDAFAVMSQI